MRWKAVVKLLIDLLMTIALLFVMGYPFWGDVLHEWVGTGMFLLFIAHHRLNGYWHKTLFQGTYNFLCVFMRSIDVLLFISMLAQMYSGIVMSRHVFSFLPSIGGMSFARRLHMFGAYGGFLFMSLHIGLHWNMLYRQFQMLARIKEGYKAHCTLNFVVGAIIAGYGAIVLKQRELFTYLLLQTEFVFFDYEESKIMFYIDYLSMMGLCIFIVHYCMKLWQRKSCRHQNEN